MMTKAERVGHEDAVDWMNENPRDEWAAAVRPGTIGADEALINALGVEAAARALGVAQAYDAEGTLRDEAAAAFKAYAEAWSRTVREACECIYCGRLFTYQNPVPSADDDVAWAALAAEHDPRCEWIATRAHRRLEVRQ